MLTPNLTTLYLMTFWNLAEQGPIVVEVPAGATPAAFSTSGNGPSQTSARPDRIAAAAASTLFVPPGSDIKEVKGYIVTRSPSNQVWFAARCLDRDHNVAMQVARKHKVYAWSQRDNPPVTKFVSIGGKDWASNQPRNLDYWKYLSEVIQPEAIEARDKVMMGMLVPLGIEKGKLFNPTERQKKILTEAAQVGELMARANAYEKRYANATVWPGKKWEYANMVELDQDDNYYTQVDERGSWFYEAIGNTAGMQGRILNFGQVYLETSRTRTATGSTAARPIASACRPMCRWCSSGRSRSTTTSRAARWSPTRARPTLRRARPGGERRRVGRPLLRADQAAQAQELGQDQSRQRLVPLLPLLRAEGGVLRQVVAAR